MTSLVSTIDPPQLHHSPAFAHGTVVQPGPVLYVGGQNGTDSTGRISGDLAEQTAQAMRNLLAVLSEAGSAPEHVAKLTIYLLENADPRDAFAASQQVAHLPRTAITVLRVAGLARPEALVEIDATAAIP